MARIRHQAVARANEAVKHSRGDLELCRAVPGVMHLLGPKLPQRQAQVQPPKRNAKRLARSVPSSKPAVCARLHPPRGIQSSPEDGPATAANHRAAPSVPDALWSGRGQTHGLTAQHRVLKTQSGWNHALRGEAGAPALGRGRLLEGCRFPMHSHPRAHLHCNAHV